MAEFFQLIGLSPELGIALSVTLSMLALIVTGMVVTKKHLDDWRAFATLQQVRADRLELALSNRDGWDREHAKMLQEININIAALQAEQRRR